MELDDNASVLLGAEFFRICDPEQGRLLAFASERRIFAEGDLLYARGEMGDGAYVLIAGAVTLGDGAHTGGKPYTVSEPGTVVGETGLMLRRPRRSSARAASEVEVLFVPQSAFIKLVKQYPAMAERAAARIRSEIDDYLGAMAPFGGDKT